MRKHSVYSLMLLILVWAVLQACSGNDEVAGSGSQVGSLSAAVVNEDGTKAPGIEVVMHPDEYNPALGKDAAGSDTVYTGEDGIFTFTDLTAGMFILVARDGNGNAVLMDEVSIPDTVLVYELKKQKLMPEGGVTGVIDLLAGGSPESTVVMILGTGYYTSPDSSGAYSFSSLPSGDLNVTVLGSAAGYTQTDSLITVESGAELKVETLVLEDRSDAFNRTLSDFHFTYDRIWYTPEGEIDRVGENNGNEEEWIRDGLHFFHDIDSVFLTGDNYYMRIFDADFQGAKTGEETREWGDYDVTLGNICFKPSKQQVNSGDTSALSEQPVKCYSWVDGGIELEGCVSQIYHRDTVSGSVYYDLKKYEQVCDEVYPDKSHADSSFALIDIWVRLD